MIDNYDSFVHNLARYFQLLGQDTLVVRNDAIDIAGVRKLHPSAIVISPGPCTPREAGCSLDIVRSFGETVPILGVCLGHQSIAEAYGATIARASVPMHGRTSAIEHNNAGLFQGIESPLTVCRYHSLVAQIESLPSCLQVTATTSEGEIMALAHTEHRVFGVQFHPESILTQSGFSMLANFLRLAGLNVPAEIPSIDDEQPTTDLKIDDWSQLPITF